MITLSEVVLEKPITQVPSVTKMLNVRIDAGLKERGDAALKNANVSPSEFVRAAYELAANNAGDPQALLDVIYPDRKRQRELDEQALLQKRLKLAQEGPKMVKEILKELGFDSLGRVASLSYKELKDIAFDEEMFEKQGVCS